MTRRHLRESAEPARLVVVCEAAADQRTACTITDRVLCAQSTWLDGEILDSVRIWSGLTPESSYVAWTAVKNEADRRGIRAHGFFDGEPGGLDARAGRRALLLLARIEPNPAGVLLIRDSDNHPDRLKGLNQARDAARCCFAVVVGVAHPKQECWLLAAFEPSSDREQRRLDASKKELGFDPRISSHCLTAQNDTAKRSAKRVLAAFYSGDTSRAETGLTQLPLDALKSRGAHNGMNAYIAEIETHLVPLFG